MLRKWTNRYALGMIAVMLVLTGCSGNSNPGNKGGEPTAAPSQAADVKETEAPGEAALDMGGYEIKYAMWWDGAPKADSPIGEMQVAKEEELMEKYNVKFSYTNIPSGEIVEKLTSTALAGEPMADIVYLESKMAIPALAEAGVIQPLDDYFDFSDPRWPGNLSNYASYKGKIYGFVTKADSSHGIWYNKKLLEDAGLPDPFELQQSGEWSWDKYLEIAKATTKDFDGDGTPDQWGITVGYDIVDQLIWSNGGSITAEVDGQYQFTLDSPKAIEALEFARKLVSEEKVVTYQSQGLFEAGNAALYGGETWMGPQLSSKLGAENLGFVGYPIGPSNKDAKYTSVTSNTGIYTFPATAKHPKEVAQIIMEKTLWDEIEGEIAAFLESNMPNPESMEVARELMRVNQLNLVEAFPGLNKVFNEIRDRVNAGESASTVIQELKPRAEEAISALYK